MYGWAVGPAVRGSWEMRFPEREAELVMALPPRGELFVGAVGTPSRAVQSRAVQPCAWGPAGSRQAVSAGSG